MSYLLEVVTAGPGAALGLPRRRRGPLFLVRPDGYIAARGTPGRLEAVLDYLRELSAEPGHGTTAAAAAARPGALHPVAAPGEDDRCGS